jgi:hypothetical protein
MVIANYLAACIQARSVTSRLLEGAEHGLSDKQWQHAYGAILAKWLAEMMANSDGSRAESAAASPPPTRKSTAVE